MALVRAFLFTNLAMFYPLLVVATAWRWGRIPAIIFPPIVVVAFDFFFIPPLRTFAPSDLKYLPGLIVTGVILSMLVERAKTGTRVGRALNVGTLRSEKRTAPVGYSQMVLDFLGLPEWAIRYFSGLAKKTGREPHEVVADIIVAAAWEAGIRRRRDAKVSDSGVVPPSPGLPS